MNKKGEKTLEEILSQPAVWQDTLNVFQGNKKQIEEFWNQEKFEKLIFIGCGSTYYLSLSAAVIFQKFTGITSIALPSSEISLFDDIYLNNRQSTLLVVISRSGETTETLHAMQTFKDGGYGKVLAITTVPNSGVTKFADFSLVADSAQEVSIAQTRSFASMLLLAEALALQVSGKNANEILAPFPEIVDRLLNQYQALAQKLGEDQSINRFFFLGSAQNFGVASEAMLKMKEMSLSNSEAFHTLEFRHGPKSMVDKNTLVIGLVNESSDFQEIPVLREMASLDAKVFSLVEKADPRLETIGEIVEFESEVDESLRALLFLPVLQLLAYHRAISNGQNPDKPHNLDAVVHIPSMTK